MRTNYSNFGLMLNNLLKSKGHRRLTDLAKAIGCTNSHIYSIAISGVVSDKTLFEIACILHRWGYVESARDIGVELLKESLRDRLIHRIKLLDEKLSNSIVDT